MGARAHDGRLPGSDAGQHGDRGVDPKHLQDIGYLGLKGADAREILTSWEEWIEPYKGTGVNWDEDDELYHSQMDQR